MIECGPLSFFLQGNSTKVRLSDEADYSTRLVIMQTPIPYEETEEAGDELCPLKQQHQFNQMVIINLCTILLSQSIMIQCAVVDLRFLNAW